MMISVFFKSVFRCTWFFALSLLGCHIYSDIVEGRIWFYRQTAINGALDQAKAMFPLSQFSILIPCVLFFFFEGRGGGAGMG